jgi:hypothetical protein
MNFHLIGFQIYIIQYTNKKAKIICHEIRFDPNLSYMEKVSLFIKNMYNYITNMYRQDLNRYYVQLFI